MFFLLISTNKLWADISFPHRSNYKLLEQINNTTGVKITDNFRMAGDLRVWKYFVRDERQYYHGPGFWMDIFSEYQYDNKTTVNLQTVILNGSTSYGYNAGAIKPFLGIAHKVSERSEFRLFDLGRQTIGDGLLVEDKLMSGLLFSTNHQNEHYFRMIFPGTGLISIYGDAWVFDYYWKRDLLFGAYLFLISDNPVKLDFSEKVVSTYIKTQEDSVWIFDLGFAYDLRGVAYQVKSGVQYDNDKKFQYKFYGMYKYYHPKFMKTYQHKIGDNYFPYELTDHKFNTMENIYANRSGEVKTYGVDADFKYSFNAGHTHLIL